MHNLDDLLGKYGPKEPAEVAAIKQYILENLQAPASVALQGGAILITVRSAALANTLRFHVAKLRAAAHTDKRLIIRIGS